MSDADGHRKQVAALRHGTVVDHLNAGTALKALEVLGLPKNGPALLGIQLESEKFGRKDILKLSGVEITEEEIARLALFGPAVTVCYIRDYRVVKKVQATLPDDLLGLLRCPNPSCITNHERVKTRFEVKQRSPLVVRCHYCELRVNEGELVLV